MSTPCPEDKSDEPKAAGRFSLGSLFDIKLSELIELLVSIPRIFVHIIAETFAIYKLLPQDYPGLDNPNISLSLSQIITTAWKNVRFTNKSAGQAILFSAVIIILVSIAIFVVWAVLSLFI